MKRIFVCTLLLMLSAGMIFAQKSADKNEAPAAVITFDKTSHDFGRFSEDNPVVKCTFTFTNEGNAPLVIHQAIASCGCTEPTYTRMPVKPGEKGTVEVTYNGEGKFPGKFKKTITVRTNAKDPMVRLLISGDMVASDKDKK